MPENDIFDMLSEGYEHQRSGRNAEAETAYGAVLTRDSKNVHALNLLGVLLVNSGRSAEAVPLLSLAAQIEPTDDETQANLGLALKQTGDFHKATVAFERAVFLKPSSPVHLNHLGNARFEFGDTAEAIRLYRRSVRMAPNYPDALSNLARALNHAGQVQAALGAAKEAIRLASTPRNWTIVGDVLTKCCDYAEAINAYDKAIAFDAGNIEALINKSIVLKETGNLSASESCLSIAHAADPDNPRIAFTRGMMLEQAGDPNQAADCYRQVLSLQPSFTAAAYQLVQLNSSLPEQTSRPVLETILRDDNAPNDSRRHAAFALARLSEHAGDHPGSLDYYAAGHNFILGESRYDPAPTQQLHASIQKANFSESASEARHPGGPSPIFVIGMPRSGTSLIEQILASHPMIAGAGESSFLEDSVRLVSQMTGVSYPEFMNLVDPGIMADAAVRYRNRLFAGQTSMTAVIDKTPMNFQYLGFAAAMLPDAKFIYCRRNPADNCLSIYRHPFDAHQTYAHSLDALRHFYGCHSKLMSCWMEKFPQLILSVSYEQVVDDLEGEAKSMLDHLGIPFDLAVLEFHKTDRIVRTPSAGQVRKPIYRDSVEYWRRYGPKVAAMASQLDDLA